MQESITAVLKEYGQFVDRTVGHVRSLLWLLLGAVSIVEVG